MPWSSRALARGTTEHDPGCSWRQWAHGLVDDAAQRAELTRVCGAGAGIFWECVPTSRDLADQPFRFVTVDSPAVAALRPDPRPFQRFLGDADKVVTFDNLGRNAVLVAPAGAVPGGCAHLASWCRTAPVEEQHAFWEAVGRAVQCWWEETDAPVWVSTSGLGVSWLHVRLDQRPKYYTHGPYRRAP